MILIESQGPVPPIQFKYMNGEGQSDISSYLLNYEFMMFQSYLIIKFLYYYLRKL